MDCLGQFTNTAKCASAKIQKTRGHRAQRGAGSSEFLATVHDDVGYDTYYEVLGEKRASKGLIKEQLDTLRDKKKIAQMGFEGGIGFIPFGGIGYEIFKTVTKNDSSPSQEAGP